MVGLDRCKMCVVLAFNRGCFDCSYYLVKVHVHVFCSLFFVVLFVCFGRFIHPFHPLSLHNNNVSTCCWHHLVFLLVDRKGHRSRVAFIRCTQAYRCTGIARRICTFPEPLIPQWTHCRYYRIRRNNFCTWLRCLYSRSDLLPPSLSIDPSSKHERHPVL